MRILILGALTGVIAAADPFDTPAVRKAADASATAQRQYMAALADAWYAAEVRPIPIPKMGPDPRESERDAAFTADQVNNRIVFMNGNFRRWLRLDEKDMTLDEALSQMLNEKRMTTDMLKMAETKGLRIPMKEVAPVLIPGDPTTTLKPKPKITATLADGTKVEQ